MVIVELIGAVIAMFSLAKAGDIRISSQLAVGLILFALGVGATGLLLWPEPSALFGLAAVLRIGYDVYSYALASPGQEIARARSYFIIFYQAILFPLAALPIGMVHELVAMKQILPGCETPICRLINPPERFIIVGVVVYPILAVLATFWKPHWKDWVITPK